MILGHLGSIIASLGQKTLPVVEFPFATITGKRLSNGATWSDTALSKPDLRFTGTELAHAVIKADFLNRVNPLMPGLAFVLQSHLLVDWQSPTLRLRNGATEVLSDFVEKSLSGRLGQGLSILHAHQEGFAFQGHLSSILVAQGLPIKDSKGQDLPIADFLIEGGSGVRGLLESKASFRQLTNCPKATKAVLKDALASQVSPWMGRLNPPATKAFAVASYVRDDSQAGTEPSVLAFVDPEDTPDGGDIQVSSAELRRENYAAWLTAMGLTDTAIKLLNRTAEGSTQVPFIVFEIAGLEFAFPWLILDMWDLIPHPHSRRSRQDFLAFGLEVRVLQAIASSIRGDDAPLTEIAPLNETGISNSENYSYSIFPDKTFLGNFDRRRPVRIIEVEL